MDKKRLIGETAPEIKQGEIDAWNRGKGDAARNKLLRASSKLTPKRAVAFLKMYADLGDLHFLANRFDVSVEECRRILAAFNIRSIEDAKKIVTAGIIAELETAEEESREDRELQAKVDHVEGQERLDEFNRQKATQEKSTEEVDQSLAERRSEAQRKNKADQLRALIAEGIDPETGLSSFRVPLERVTQFKNMIVHGVHYLQRQFGGTPADIKREIQRLAPDFDVDLLRP